MSSKLFSLFPWLKLGLSKNTVLGIAVYGSAVNAVCLTKSNGQWLVAKYHSIDVSDESDYMAAIAACTNAVCKEPCKVNLVLPHFFYQIVQMEKPTLSDDEITQSLPWLAKDFVDIAPENIVADFTDYPISLPMQSNKMNVFITNKEQVKPLVDVFKKLKPALRSITSEEMILVTLFGNDSHAHMLIVQHVGHEPRILIIRNGQLLLARRLNGLLGLINNSQSLIESLGLEIQRSMDFFESQLKQPPIRSIQLQCDDLSSLSLKAGLAEYLEIQVTDFTPQIDIAQSLEPSYYYALGAAFQLIDTELVE
ncbi:MSHA biogenesis protein MshI [Pseudoalteromonas sp. MMG010]|uniref:MSHA biogenesis protein MshI n=1 Tax=Pseudoalteromonas sp. MMG010 TaxID=2822685 RepID=UPI001B3A65D5|nr:MSHA biogenesis protein MshI [Pseudoalteromonas sp. MMG010]MBQ4832646.1 MSHA biogenesis protein MshI [Pseudoalteromonas sp. MMG010]